MSRGRAMDAVAGGKLDVGEIGLGHCDALQSVAMGGNVRLGEALE